MSDEVNLGGAGSADAGSMEKAVAPAAETLTKPMASDAPAAGGEAAGGDAESQKARIKIGTQRAGVPVPRIEPRAKVAFRTTPASGEALAKPVAPAEALANPVAHNAGATAIGGGQEAPLPRFSPGEDAAGGGAGAGEMRPKPFVGKPLKKINPKFEKMVPPSAKVEKPNLRAPLSDDLQAELDAALGSQSLEDLIEAETGATGGESTGEQLEVESRHKGKVLRIFRDSVFMDLGGRNQGVLVLHQLPEEPAVGAEIDVVVSKYNAEDGLYELMLVGGSVDVGDWSDVTEGITVEARVTGHNKGGLECEVNKIRGFIPAGQISIYRAENFEEFVGQSLQCVVVEANRDRKNLVLSHRAIMERDQAEAREKILAELEVGQTREGTVRNIRDFGAFVDLGGIDGMIHVSQMSWDRVKHPSEVLTLGQKVKVKIQKIDPETHKISLAYRDLFESPWINAASKYPVTSKVTGTVSKIMDFGAFVKLEPGIEGLVHVSELSFKRVHRVGDIVKEGQQIEAKVLSVDPENQRISLSMKALEARPTPVDKKQQELEAIYAAQETAPPVEKKKRKAPLQGGLGRSPIGDKFGLKW